VPVCHVPAPIVALNPRGVREERRPLPIGPERGVTTRDRRRATADGRSDLPRVSRRWLKRVGPSPVARDRRVQSSGIDAEFSVGWRLCTKGPT